MAGQIKRLLDQIIAERSRGDETIALLTKTKLTLKGLNPDRFTHGSPDDPSTIEKVRQAAASLNVRLA